MKFIQVGQPSQDATATADTTNAGTLVTPNVMTGMTLTPDAGTYLVSFSTNVDHSAQSIAVVVSLFVGGTQDADTVRAPVPRFNALGANSLNPGVSITALATVNGGQAIDIRWGTASGTATAHQRTLAIARVA